MWRVRIWHWAANEHLSSLTEIQKYSEYWNYQPLMAWSILQSKFMACDEEANLPYLDMAFVMCRLDGTTRDQKL
jgi:hypothetical protein